MTVLQAETNSETKAKELSNEHLWNGADTKQSLAYKVPEFTVPYPLKINCHADKASKDTHEWLHDQGVDVFLGPEAYKKLIAGNYPGLASRIYVDASPEGLDWAAKYITRLFAVDDQIEETDVGYDGFSAMEVILEYNLVFLWSFPNDPIILQNLNKFHNAVPGWKSQRKDWDSSTGQ
jgi:hypothetical protein